MMPDAPKKITSEYEQNKLPGFCMGSLYLALITWFAIYAMTE